MPPHTVDLSVSKGLYWWKQQKPSKEGILTSARRVTGNSADSTVFTHVTYGHSADRFAAADRRGNIYVFHLRSNRFSLIHAAAQEVTAMTFCCGLENDLMVAYADHSICIVKSDTGFAAAKLTSHRARVTSMAPHPMERYAVSCGADNTFLWDLSVLRRVRNIGGRGTCQVAFLQSGNCLVTLNRTEGISLFHFPTLDLRARLSPDSSPGVSLRCFSITANRMFLVAATSASTAYVWHLPSETMCEDISLPSPVALTGGLQPMMPGFTTAMPEGSEMSMLGEDGVLRIISLPDGRVTAVVGKACHTYAIYNDLVVSATSHLALNLIHLPTLRSSPVSVHDTSAASTPRPIAPLCPSSSSNHTQSSHRGGDEAPRPLPSAITSSMPTTSKAKSSNQQKRSSTKSSSSSKRSKAVVAFAMPSGASRSDQGWYLRTDKLRAFLDMHSSFLEDHRLGAWTHLLRIPHNQTAYRALISLGEHAFGVDQLQRCQVKDTRVRARLHRCVHALCHWSEALAYADFLPGFALPIVRFFGRDEHAALEACIMLIKNWSSSWFDYWPAPPLHIASAAERLIFLHDPPVVKHMIALGVSASDYLWPVLSTLFSQVTDVVTWMSIIDKLLVSPAQMAIYLLAAFAVHMRGALLSIDDASHITTYFTSRIHAVDLHSLFFIAGKMQETARQKNMFALYGLASPDSKSPLIFLRPADQSSSYPLLTSFPDPDSNRNFAPMNRIREQEERYLRRKKLTAELEEQARSSVIAGQSAKEHAEFEQRARLEQRKQLEMAIAYRRERMKELDEREVRTRLAQIQALEMEAIEGAPALQGSSHQLDVLRDLERELEEVDEEEQLLRRGMEAEALQQIEIEALSRLQRQVDEGRALMGEGSSTGGGAWGSSRMGEVGAGIHGRVDQGEGDELGRNVGGQGHVAHTMAALESRALQFTQASPNRRPATATGGREGRGPADVGGRERAKAGGRQQWQRPLTADGGSPFKTTSVRESLRGAEKDEKEEEGKEEVERPVAPRKGETGYWQLRAALAGIKVRSQEPGDARQAPASVKATPWEINSSGQSREVGNEHDESDGSSSTGVDHESQAWVREDVAMAKHAAEERFRAASAAMALTSTARDSAKHGGSYEFMVHVKEDSSGYGDLGDSSSSGV